MNASERAELDQRLGKHRYVVPERENGRTIRSVNEPAEFLLAVSPSGAIKCLSFSVNGMSSKLIGQQIIHNKRLIGYKHVTLNEQARMAGWVLLEELCQDDNERENIKVVYAWYRKVNDRKSGKVAPLSDDYLPVAYFEFKRKAKEAKIVDLPPAAGRSAEGAKAVEAAKKAAAAIEAADAEAKGKGKPKAKA